MAVVKHEEILPKTSEVNAQAPGNELCRSGWMLTRELCTVPENLVFALAGESTSVCFIFPRVPRVGCHLGFSGTQLLQQILPTPGPPSPTRVTNTWYLPQERPLQPLYLAIGCSLPECMRERCRLSVHIQRHIVPH